VSPSLPSGKLSNIVPDVSAEVVAAVCLPALGIILSELLLYAGSVTQAIWGYVVTLAVCTVTPVYFRDGTTVFLAFVLLPVFRILNLSMPVFVELTLYWLVLVYLPFVPAGVLVARHGDALNLSPEWRRVLLWLPVGLVGGSALATLSAQFETRALLVPAATFPNLLALVGVVIVAGGVEELLFRVILQTTLQRHLGTWLGIAVAGGVFATTRIPKGGVAVAIAFAAGLAYGIAYHRSGSLIIPLLFHGVANALLFVVFPVYGLPSGYV
jgi:membrane protease YdiL (CAAX protease family)